MQKITEMFLQEQKEDILNIAKRMLAAESDLIQRVTLLTKEEISNIKKG